jgi:hypothetical protein
MLKSVRNEKHFTLGVRKSFWSVSPLYCSGVTEGCNMALPAHALRAVQGRLKRVSNVGHFTVDAENFIFRVTLHTAVG